MISFGGHKPLSRVVVGVCVGSETGISFFHGDVGSVRFTNEDCDAFLFDNAKQILRANFRRKRALQ